MLKHNIRKVFLQKRKHLSDSVVNKMNLNIDHLFKELLTVEIKTVHVYLPIESKDEIDTWPIIRNLWKKSIRVVVPVVNNESIISTLLSAKSELVLNKWNVPEPIERKAINKTEIDMVIVPLVAFDIMGYRVGYGKGYYDKFLASLPQNPIKIGLSFFSPIASISDKGSWDIPLNYCVTPEMVFRF